MHFRLGLRTAEDVGQALSPANRALGRLAGGTTCPTPLVGVFIRFGGPPAHGHSLTVAAP